MKSKVWIVAVLLGLGVAGAVAWWVLRERDAGISYRSARIERGSLQAAVSASGTVTPVTQVQVSSQVSGQIKELFVDFNSEVKAGQLIARLDPETFEYRLRQANADVEAARATVLTAQANVLQAMAQVGKARVDVQEAQRDLERKQDLVAKNFISAVEAERASALVRTLAESLKATDAQVAVARAQAQNAQAIVKQREAQLAQARVDVERTQIRSPVTGIVIKRSVEVGQTVAASLQAPELFVIAANLNDMQVETSIDEADIARVRAAQKVNFTIDAFPGRSFEGAVKQVRKAAVSAQNVTTYTVVVAFSNPGASLLPGMTANVRIVTETRDNSLKIPNAALRVRIAGVGPAHPELVKGLTAVALGGSVPTPTGGLTAPVVELQSLDQLKTADVKGKIVFFNRPMNPLHVSTGRAYGEAGDQRNRGPGEAGKYGAVGALVRSLTLAHDDVPHTGNTTYQPDVPRIPAAALSTIATDTLRAALRVDPALRVSMEIHSQWFADAESHNVIGELKGSASPEKIILVGGHLDSWDIAPGAHDDGAGCVQSIEVLRLLKAVGYVPRHTLRVVLFTNEENGLRGAAAYSTAAKEKNEILVLALETDSGGFQPKGFNLGNPAGNAHLLAARWKPLFEPYGVYHFQLGTGGADVGPLLAHGATVAGLQPDSQRYFDLHHTTRDSIDQVNPRELQLGAAAMAALVYLVDKYGL